MADVTEAMIVAGGAGTRLRPLTDTTPKPLLPFCGAPFLAGVVRRLAAAGVRRVLLIVGADPAPFEILRGEARRHGVHLEAVAEPEPLDTAGGVREACERVTGPFLVLNGDILTDVDLTEVVAAHRAAGADGTLVLSRVEDTSTFGVTVLDGSRIVDFVEKPAPGSLPGQDAVNAGTYVLEPAAMAGFDRGPLSFEREVFPTLLERGAHIEGWVSSRVWADLGTPERFLAGHRLALDGALRWPTLADLPRDGDEGWRHPSARVEPGAVLAGPVLVGAGARIEAGAKVGPHAVVGAGARVERDASLTDTVLFDGARLGRGASAAGTLLGHRARLGEGAVAEPGVVVGDDVVVDAATHLAAGTHRPDDTGGDA